MAKIVKKTNNQSNFPKIVYRIEDAKVKLSERTHRDIFSKMKGYSKREICNKLNICKKTYNNWKNKSCGISLNKLYLISKLFSIKINLNGIDRFNKKLYEFNDNYKEWLVPDRPWFNSSS
ncbi:MAG: hypothetical protein KKG75_02325 [Nanoarchaeota archaeon]|nr:hypothetical protein [Nanoarchaeota archaeon]